MTDRPGGLKPLCIIGIILGSMGLAGVLFGALAQLAQPKLPVPAPDPKFAELNAEFGQRMKAVNAGMAPYLWTLYPFSAASSALLLAGGVLGLKGRGRSAMTAAFAASLAVDLGSLVIGIVTQLRTSDTMTWYFREMSALDPAKAPPGMAGILSGSMMAGIGIGVVWYLGKAAYYLWGLLYVRKPEVRSWLGATSGPSSPAKEGAPSS